MKRTALLIVGTALAMQAVGVTAAFAAYNPNNNINLNLNTGLPLTLPSTTGNLTFGAQQSVNQTVQGTSGLNYDYSYVVVSVDGSNVAAVDPPSFMY